MNKLTPINFPYGATSAPYSATRPHRGNDRAGSTGEPIYIGDTVIGLVGATGWATGPHLHTQAGTDIACQNTFNPSSVEFKGGTVVNTGFGSQWGNFVTIQVGSKYVTYCHLSKINVTKGQVIKEEELITSADKNRLRIINSEIKGWDFNTVHSGKLDAREVGAWSGQTWQKAIDQAWKEGEAYRKAKAAQSKQIADLQKALANEKNKPPQTVIKEVEKIVEKIVEKEVVKEVPVGEEQAVRGFFDKLLSLVFRK